RLRTAFGAKLWFWITFSNLVLLSCGDDGGSPLTEVDGGVFTEHTTDSAIDESDDAPSNSDGSGDVEPSDETESPTDDGTDEEQVDTDTVEAGTCPIQRCEDDERLIPATGPDCECVSW